MSFSSDDSGAGLPNHAPIDNDPNRHNDGGYVNPNRAPIFAQKTYKMINTADDALACWSPDGASFVIKDPNVFGKTIIPKFFKHNKFSSFARQLNFYGFRRLQGSVYKQDSKHVTFFHDMFQRGKPHLLTHIFRSTRKQNEKDTQSQIRELISLVTSLRSIVMGLMQNQIQLPTLQQENQMITACEGSQPISELQLGSFAGLNTGDASRSSEESAHELQNPNTERTNLKRKLRQKEAEVASLKAKMQRKIEQDNDDDHSNEGYDNDDEGSVCEFLNDIFDEGEHLDENCYRSTACSINHSYNSTSHYNQAINISIVNRRGRSNVTNASTNVTVRNRSFAFVASLSLVWYIGDVDFLRWGSIELISFSLFGVVLVQWFLSSASKRGTK